MVYPSPASALDGLLGPPRASLGHFKNIGKYREISGMKQIQEPLILPFLIQSKNDVIITSINSCVLLHVFQPSLLDEMVHVL